MEHSIQYYRDLLQFLNLAIDQDRQEFSYDEGVSLLPDYWVAIAGFLKDNGLANSNYGNIYIHQLPLLSSVRADCRARIAEMEQTAKDRELCNKHRLEGIIQGRRSHRLSKIALWISAIVGAGQIAQWIIMLLK